MKPQKKHVVMGPGEWVATLGGKDARRRARREALALEWQAQAAVVSWARSVRLPAGGRLHLWHTKNSAKRSGHQGAVDKRLGVTAGVPDLLLSTRVPGRPEVRGVALELKVAGRKATPAQLAWMSQARADG
jgi:hypothetical protein